ncbi:MAG: (d)CMP kinase [Bacteroidetes bacterium]|nr:MAG: (d)CMP kinase [Bacteroidota bacterium]
MKKIIIAIDGYSACGKSSTAKLVAKQLNYAYIDTGAMYRAVTLYFLQEKTNFQSYSEVEKALEKINISFERNPENQANETFLNEVNVENSIRNMEIASRVSEVASLSAVRKFLVAQQQKMGEKKAVVLDGRDIGTVVFPKAELKIFMTADADIRAQRRQDELLAKNEKVALDEIKRNLLERDYADSNRADSPLRQADDAKIVDTTHLTMEQQVSKIIELAHQKIF